MCGPWKHATENNSSDILLVKQLYNKIDTSRLTEKKCHTGVYPRDKSVYRKSLHFA